MPKQLGLALGGGIARCLVHIGVLQALELEGIRPGLIAGSSGGALVGAAYGLGLSPAQILSIAAETRWRDLVSLHLRRDCLLDCSGLNQLLVRLYGRSEFSAMRIPVAVVAADVVTGEEIVIDQGLVAPAVRASCSIPGLFDPVRMNGLCLVDGGLVNSLPVALARQRGAELVMAVDLSCRGELVPPKNLVQVIFYALNVMQENQARPSREAADLLVMPELPGLGFFELDRWAEYFEAGLRAGQAAVPKLKEML